MGSYHPPQSRRKPYKRPVNKHQFCRMCKQKLGNDRDCLNPECKRYVFRTKRNPTL